MAELTRDELGDVVIDAVQTLYNLTGAQVLVTVWHPHHDEPVTCSLGNHAGVAAMLKGAASSLLREERPVCEVCARGYDLMTRAHDALSGAPTRYHE